MAYQQQQQVKAFDASAVVASYQTDFRTVLTDQAMSWQKEFQFAEQAFIKNEILGKTAAQNPASLRAAIINVAAIGISLNPALKHAYLVPRKGEICLDISYQGLLHLAVKEGAIMWGQAELVYSNDTYKNLGVDCKPQHEYEAFGERGNKVGCYCTVKLPSGDYLTEEMDIASINYVASTSMGIDKDWSPWKKWWGQMARKTVIKRASNYWPKCHLVHEAVAVLNLHEGLDQEHLIKDIPEEAEQPTNSKTLNTLLTKPDNDNDFESQLKEAKTIKQLHKVGMDIKDSGDGSIELRAMYTKRKAELENV